MSIISTIKNRKSCRSFDPVEIEQDKVKKINEFINNINLNSKIKSRFLLGGFISDNKAIGSYGTIWGCNNFIIGVLDKNENKYDAFGYQFEQIILLSTELGLGTCWLGGTFNRSDFQSKTDLSDNEFIPIISPLGYSSDKRKFSDKFIRAIAGSDNRKEWKEIFFDESYGSELVKDKACDFMTPLEMVRIAPSASNKQPWRIIRRDGNFEFYLQRTKGYGLVGFDIQMIDIGIAMCHFELASHELNLPGSWIYEPNNVPSDLEYISTWRI